MSIRLLFLLLPFSIFSQIFTEKTTVELRGNDKKQTELIAYFEIQQKLNRKLADYILENFKDSLDMTPAKLATINAGVYSVDINSEKWVENEYQLEGSITYKNEFRMLRLLESSYTLKYMWPNIDSLCKLDKNISAPLDSYKLTYDARLLANVNDTLGALSIFQKAVDIYSDNQYAQCALGSLFSDLGKDQEALRYYEKALKIDPQYFIVYGYISFSYLKLDDIDSAFYNTKKLIELSDGKSTDGYYYETLIYLELEQYDKAKISNEKAYVLAPVDIDVIFHKARILSAFEEYEQAIRIYHKVIAKDPEYSDAYFNIALDYSDLINPDSCYFYFDAYQKLCPYDNDVLYSRAFAKETLGNIEGAIEDLDTYIAKEPKDPEGYTLRAYCNSELKHHEIALRDYEIAIKLEPENPYHYLDKALELEELNRFQEALSTINTAIKLDPNLAELYSVRSYDYDMLENLNMAMQDINKAIELDPTEFSYYYQRAGLKEQLNNIPGAQKDYTKALELNPKDEFSYYGRGLNYYTEDDYVAAVKDFNKAINIDNTDPDFYFYRGASYMQGCYNCEQAARDFSKVIKLDPSYEDVYYYRGIAYYNSHNYEKGCADWEISNVRGNKESKKLIKEYCK